MTNDLRTYYLTSVTVSFTEIFPVLPFKCGSLSGLEQAGEEVAKSLQSSQSLSPLVVRFLTPALYFVVFLSLNPRWNTSGMTSAAFEKNAHCDVCICKLFLCIPHHREMFCFSLSIFFILIHSEQITGLLLPISISFLSN